MDVLGHDDIAHAAPCGRGGGEHLGSHASGSPAGSHRAGQGPGSRCRCPSPPTN